MTANPQEKKPQNRLKQLRVRAGLTQIQIAEKLDITVQAVCRHETSSRGLVPEMISRYAEIFNVQPHELYIKFPEAPE